MTRIRSSTVDLPRPTGRLDKVTAFAVRALAEDSTLSLDDVRREYERVVGERRRQQAAERARRRAAVEQVAADVAAAIRKG